MYFYCISEHILVFNMSTIALLLSEEMTAVLIHFNVGDRRGGNQSASNFWTTSTILIWRFSRHINILD